MTIMIDVRNSTFKKKLQVRKRRLIIMEVKNDYMA